VSLWRQLTRGLRALIHSQAADRDAGDEVDHYLEQATDAFVASGLSLPRLPKEPHDWSWVARALSAKRSALTVGSIPFIYCLLICTTPRVN
jgi:hypothetical protein